MEMLLAIHQPSFMPWLPWFQKVGFSDTFVFLNHVQYPKGKYCNRFHLDGKWFTMSVEKGLDPIITKKYVDPERDWKKIKKGLPQYRSILDKRDGCISDNLASI